jgi:hypothetical protein
MGTTPTVAYGQTTEVLAKVATVTQIPRITYGRAIEMYNNGPNTVWATLNDPNPASGKCRPIPPGGSWAMDVPYTCPIYVICDTLDQVSGGGLIVNDVRKLN